MAEFTFSYLLLQIDWNSEDLSYLGEVRTSNLDFEGSHQ